jgi:hypothetical protein
MSDNHETNITSKIKKQQLTIITRTRASARNFNPAIKNLIIHHQSRGNYLSTLVPKINFSFHQGSFNEVTDTPLLEEVWINLPFPA